MAHTPTNPCARCGASANSVCNGCRLVLYCEKECQLQHWPTHRVICRSNLSKDTWKPTWVMENRDPLFFKPQSRSYGGRNYHWGNTPALDVLRLPENEGKDYAKDLRILYAASGDLRNVIMTINSLPPEYEKAVCSIINDKNIEIVARNAFLLLIALTAEDASQAADVMIHIWYSAFIRNQHLCFLAEKVAALIQDVVTEIEHRPTIGLLKKTWKFGQTSIQIALEKDAWDKLLLLCQQPPHLSFEEARELRLAVVMADSRIDYRDRKLLQVSAKHRPSYMRFWTSGVLAPFGGNLDDFTIPNPTLFASAIWPMSDAADPLTCWSTKEVLETKSGPATNDLHGKLLTYLRNTLCSFYDRIRDRECTFELFNLDAKDLHAEAGLASGSLARIETSNIADMAYLRVDKTIASLGQLLEHRQDNAHATLVTCFLNAVEESIRNSPDQASITSAALAKAQRYFPNLGRMVIEGHHGVYSNFFQWAADLLQDREGPFDRYMTVLDFQAIEKEYGMKIKDRNTIIPKWPLRLELQPGQPGAKEELEALIASGHLGSERYMEWERGV